MGIIVSINAKSDSASRPMRKTKKEESCSPELGLAFPALSHQILLILLFSILNLSRLLQFLLPETAGEPSFCFASDYFFSLREH